MRALQHSTTKSSYPRLHLNRPDAASLLFDGVLGRIDADRMRSCTHDRQT